jgi:hypothetical protein
MFLLALLLIAGLILNPNLQADAPAQINAGEQLIVWTAPAVQPGEQRADATGQLALLGADGTLTPLFDVPPQSNRVTLCGANAISGDGRKGVFFMGLDGFNGGELFMVTEGGTPVKFDGVFENRGYGFQFLGCQGGNGRLSFTPDNQRLIFMAYERDARQSTFADGYLRVINANDLSEQYLKDNVVAYTLNNTKLAFVQFFTDDRNRADEVAVFTWDGSKETEIASFSRPEETCEYTSAYTKFDPQDGLWLILGERCRELVWQLYKLDPANRSAELKLTATPRGGMKPFVETNNLLFSPDGSLLFYTLADGVTNETVSLYGVPVADMSAPKELIPRDGRFPSYSEGKLGGENTFPRISPNGEWLAVVVEKPTRESSLYLINLTSLDVPPIVIPAGSRGDTIAYVEFLPDASGVVFIAGGSNPGDDNSIFVVALEQGAQAERVLRGKFSWGARLSPDGTRLGVAEWQVQPEGVLGPDFLNFVVINLADASRTTLFTGATVTDGKVSESIRFVFPLWWR